MACVEVEQRCGSDAESEEFNHPHPLPTALMMTAVVHHGVDLLHITLILLLE